ncbi:hypothetical protein C8Q74DRAFT_7572 [Fomes fomentarius]|nr:hypothetical protein C8Q74DRAFT_7572 [Fomes fomentarius]
MRFAVPLCSLDLPSSVDRTRTASYQAFARSPAPRLSVISEHKIRWGINSDRRNRRTSRLTAISALSRLLQSLSRARFRKLCRPRTFESRFPLVLRRRGDLAVRIGPIERPASTARGSACCWLLVAGDLQFLVIALRVRGLLNFSSLLCPRLSIAARHPCTRICFRRNVFYVMGILLFFVHSVQSHEGVLARTQREAAHCACLAGSHGHITPPRPD